MGCSCAKLLIEKVERFFVHGEDELNSIRSIALNYRLIWGAIIARDCHQALVHP